MTHGTYAHAMGNLGLPPSCQEIHRNYKQSTELVVVAELNTKGHPPALSYVKRDIPHAKNYDRKTGGENLSSASKASLLGPQRGYLAQCWR